MLFAEAFDIEKGILAAEVTLGGVGRIITVIGHNYNDGIIVDVALAEAIKIGFD